MKSTESLNILFLWKERYFPRSTQRSRSAKRKNVREYEANQCGLRKSRFYAHGKDSTGQQASFLPAINADF